MGTTERRHRLQLHGAASVAAFAAPRPDALLPSLRVTS